MKNTTTEIKNKLGEIQSRLVNTEKDRRTDYKSRGQNSGNPIRIAKHKNNF